MVSWIEKSIFIKKRYLLIPLNFFLYRFSTIADKISSFYRFYQILSISHFIDWSRQNAADVCANRQFVKYICCNL